VLWDGGLISMIGAPARPRFERASRLTDEGWYRIPDSR
jgi:hypothetical protein